MTIRPFTPDDYPAVTRLINAVYPEHPLVEEELRAQDERRDARCYYETYLSEVDGQVVGRAEFSQMMWMYHPQKFGMELMVHPDHRRRGIGSGLYDHLTKRMAPLDPLAVRTRAQENRPDSLAFLTKRGFVEEMRHWESHLDMATYDPTPFAADVARMGEQGIVIKSYHELENQPDILPRLYELTTTVGRDVPSPEPHTDLPYEQWLRFFDNPNFIPEATLVAIDTRAGGRYVGFSNIFKSLADTSLNTGLTGILPEYRRRGIAMALKLRALAYAQSVGASLVRTSNASINRGMLGINERVGFVKQPIWINFALILKEENA